MHKRGEVKGESDGGIRKEGEDMEAELFSNTTNG